MSEKVVNWESIMLLMVLLPFAPLLLPLSFTFCGFDTDRREMLSFTFSSHAANSSLPADNKDDPPSNALARSFLAGK
jgi:hypothetical protein